MARVARQWLEPRDPATLIDEPRGCAQDGGLLDRLLAGASNPASPSTREDALQGLRALAEGGGAAAERHLLRALPVLLERQGDKVCPG